MADIGGVSFSVASVVEDVLLQHGNHPRELDFDARRAEAAAMRRYEAATWLRKTVGVVAAKGLPAEPSEEEFRLALRNGIILCNALNKVQSGAVQKVVESPCDPGLIPNGAALSVYQYFENVRNFLVAVQQMGIPAFEVSDLEQGGNPFRIVNCVLALKSYNEWRQTGASGVWKFGGNVKTVSFGKQFIRKNSEPFTSSLSRNVVSEDKSLEGVCSDNDINRTTTSSLSTLVQTMLRDKKPEEVPNIVESILNKVVKEFEHHIASQNGLDASSKPSHRSTFDTSASIVKKNDAEPDKGCMLQGENCNGVTEFWLKNQSSIGKQQKDIKALKHTLSCTKANVQLMQRKFNDDVQNLGLHVLGLAHAASGYHKVLEENRKLHNEVQDLKGSIRVYCRVRPFLPGQVDQLSTVDHIGDGTITINTMTKNAKGRKSFNFNKVFGPCATQEEVFSDTQQLIRSVLDGYNVCIFAYGQTGSGKTYTMTGPKDLTEQSQGVNYRALNELFLLSEQRKDAFCYDVSVQMIEIYNEQVRDLLVTDGSCKRLDIRNSSQTGLSVPDASLVRVSSTSDVIDLMNLGHRNRAVGATALNDRSSRSHSCLMVHVQGRDLTSGTSLRGCMHLVDLAGSERVDKSEVTGDRLKEAQHINRSLSALGDVISSLAQKNTHVPYRNSKLTQLLQDSLGGQAKTLMFVHISPEPDAIGETISTLKFAERVETVELGAARVNKDPQEVKELKEQIARLKAELAKKGGESVVPGSPHGTQTSPFSPASIARNTKMQSPNSLRRPMEEVGNIEACNNPALKEKGQKIDADELLVNSPIWPPVISPCQNNGDDVGEWIDKPMVKQDLCGNMDPCQKYPSENDLFSIPSCDLVRTGNDDFDELVDAGTIGDSSETDLLWQYNKHSKLGDLRNGADKKFSKGGSFVKQPSASPEFRTMILKPTPLRKGDHPPKRIGRQTMETKRRMVTKS